MGIKKNIGYALLGLAMATQYSCNNETQRKFQEAKPLETTMQSLNTADLDSILKHEGLNQSQYYNMYDAILSANPGMKQVVNYGDGIPKDNFIAKKDLKYVTNHGKNIKIPDYNNDGKVYGMK